MTVFHPIPIGIFTVLALLFLLFSRQAGGVKCVLVASYCGITIISFTGGSSGGIWLGPIFLLLVGPVILMRHKKRAVLGSVWMVKLTHTMFIIFLFGVIVGLLRFDPEVEFQKAGHFRTLFGIPIRYLMATYRLHIITFLFLAFTVALRYYVDRKVFLRCLVLCWVFTMVMAVLGTLQHFHLGNFRFRYGQLEAASVHLGVLGFGRAGQGNMLVTGIFMCFAMTQLTRSHLLKMLGYASIPIFIAAILFSHSRAAAVALVVGGVSLAITLGGARAFKGILMILVGAIVIYIALMWSPDLRERFLSFAGPGGESLVSFSAGRVLGWAGIWKLLAASPGILTFGVGFENFHYFVNLSLAAVELEAAHNNFLHVLVELGVLGFIVSISWLVSIFVWLISWRRTMADKVDRMLPGIFMSLMLSLAASCMFGETLSPSPAMVSWMVHFYLILGIWISYYRTQMAELSDTLETEYWDYEEAQVREPELCVGS